MSPFALVVDKHAMERFQLRGIIRQKIRRTIIQGELIDFQQNGRKSRRLRFGSRTLEVIYVDMKLGYAVVTAYWIGEFP
ncbi:DUF4258 domain-containing protein [Bdellovibrionota bacterium FG-2]